MMANEIKIKNYGTLAVNLFNSVNDDELPTATSSRITINECRISEKK